MGKGFNRENFWRVVDRLLLLLIVGLVALNWRATVRQNELYAASAARGGVEQVASAPGRAEGVAEVAEPEPEPMAVTLTRSSWLFQGESFGSGQRRLDQIARTLVRSGWDNMPTRPATDMREQDGYYDIFVSLPGSMDPKSARVATSGNILSLYVSGIDQPGVSFVKRFYVPSGLEQAESIETSVSNNLVRVRVRQFE